MSVKSHRKVALCLLHKKGQDPDRWKAEQLSATITFRLTYSPQYSRIPSMSTTPSTAHLPRPGGHSRALRQIIAWFFFAIELSGIAIAQRPVDKLPTLTRAEQIRKLRPEEAAKGYPVKIRGVITMDAPAPDFFVQDGTAGIYVEGDTSQRFVHTLARFVEIEGVTGPGKFAPVIREQKFRDLGTGNLPQAHLFEFPEIADGQQDSQWIQVRGIVRSAAMDRSSWRETAMALRVASGGGEFNVRVPVQRETSLSSWIDSEVLIEGVCGSLYNANRQLTGILFYVPRPSFIQIEAQAPEVPLSGLLLFSPSEGARHRVRVRGVVEYQQLGKSLFLQGEGKGLRVQSPQNTPVDVGDVVEVIGFPAMGESTPILEDAAFQRVGQQITPQSIPLALEKPWERYDGELVSTDAKLVNRTTQLDGLRLLLQHGDLIFDATLPAGTSTGLLSSIPLNSEVRVSGVCLVRSGGLWQIPQSFRLLLRSPEDVVLLKKASWWTSRHTLWLLAITAGTLLIVLVWMMVLRRRVREQMEVIRQKLRSSAVLEERNRIARELHDTLEQELAGITLQLDLAVDCFLRAPRVAQQAVETARNMSRHSMVEARRSVWDLRCQLLEDGDLVSALSQIVAPLAPADGRIQVKIEGKPVRLPGPIEMNLLRIGQEAVGNAVKHGRARAVAIELRYTPAFVRLTVTDDGKGFDAEQSSRTGHFGILDMRERAQSMGSRLHIQSDPAKGTTVSIEVRPDSQEMLDDEQKANTYSGR
jgi:signal transduction histidine kinase